MLPAEAFGMKTVSFTDFRSRASALLDAVERGETLVVLRHGKPVAEIHPVGEAQPRPPSWRRPGPRLASRGAELASAILKERSREDVF